MHIDNKSYYKNKDLKIEDAPDLIKLYLVATLNPPEPTYYYRLKIIYSSIQINPRTGETHLFESHQFFDSHGEWFENYKKTGTLSPSLALCDIVNEETQIGEGLLMNDHLIVGKWERVI